MGLNITLEKLFDDIRELEREEMLILACITAWPPFKSKTIHMQQRNFIWQISLRFHQQEG